MKAHFIDKHFLVPRSRSSAKVKVKYQGHVSQKMGVLGALVFFTNTSCFFQVDNVALEKVGENILLGDQINYYN